jgi:hypothetical protein
MDTRQDPGPDESSKSDDGNGDDNGDDDDVPLRGMTRALGEHNLELSSNYNHYTTTDERTATAPQPKLLSKEERAAKAKAEKEIKAAAAKVKKGAKAAAKAEGGKSGWLGSSRKKASPQLVSAKGDGLLVEKSDLLGSLPAKAKGASSSKKRFSLGIMDMGSSSKEKAKASAAVNPAGGVAEQRSRPGAVVRRPSMSTLQMKEAALSQPQIALAVGSRTELHKSFAAPSSESGFERLGPRMTALDFVRRVPAQPFGVLGMKLDSSTSAVVEGGPDPHCVESCCVVTTEGLNTIMLSGGPKQACADHPAGSAAAVYTWLGIENNDAFEAAVCKALKATGDAKYLSYTTRSVHGDDEAHIIHTVAPNLGKPRGPFAPAWSRPDAVATLATAYKNVFLQFTDSEQSLLRLAPISGAHFAGAFLAEMPALTFEAMQVAFDQLNLEERGSLIVGEVHLCLFNEVRPAAPSRL